MYCKAVQFLPHVMYNINNGHSRNWYLDPSIFVRFNLRGRHIATHETTGYIWMYFHELNLLDPILNIIIYELGLFLITFHIVGLLWLFKARRWYSECKLHLLSLWKWNAIIITSTKLKKAYGTDCFSNWVLVFGPFLVRSHNKHPSFSANPSVNRLSQELATRMSA